MAEAPAAAIFITGTPGAYSVAVIPSDDASANAQTFETHKQAYGFAAGLRMTTGLGVADLSIQEEAR